MSKREIYEHIELDYDGSYYYFTNRDVEMYPNNNDMINKLFARFENRAKQYLYIKGNKLYFTVDGKKYWTILTHSTWEWQNIKKLIKALKIYAQDIVYVYGELD